MLFALAGHLGMTVGELGERMTSSEVSEWAALIAVEPWGCYRQDLLNAISAYASAAPWCKGTKISDWMPDFNRKPAELDRDGLKAYLLAIGGKQLGNHQPHGDQSGVGGAGG